MSCQPEKRARAEAMLGELAELGLMVARELAVRTRECEDVDQTVALAGAFQKVSRVVRLTVALDFKLERDAARDAQAQAREAEKAQAEAAQQRPVLIILKIATWRDVTMPGYQWRSRGDAMFRNLTRARGTEAF